MNHKLYQIAILLMMIIGSVLIVMWMFVWNKTTLIIHNAQNTEVFINTQSLGLCDTDKCIHSIAPGEYEITLKKDGYFAKTVSKNMVRGQETIIDETLEFIPILKQIDVATFKTYQPRYYSTSLPKNISQKAVSITPSPINNNSGGKVFYFLPESNQIRSIHEKEDTLVTIFEAKNPRIFVSNNSENLLITNQNGTYKIHVPTGTKTKLTNEPLNNVLWNNNQAILSFQQSTPLIHFNTETLAQKQISYTTPLPQTVWKNNTELIQIESNGIALYNIETQKTTPVATLNNIPINQVFINPDKTKVAIASVGTYFELQLTPEAQE